MKKPRRISFKCKELGEFSWTPPKSVQKVIFPNAKDYAHFTSKEKKLLKKVTEMLQEKATVNIGIHLTLLAWLLVRMKNEGCNRYAAIMMMLENNEVFTVKKLAFEAKNG